MRKLERIVDTIINAQNPSTVLVTGGDQGIYDYLITKVDTVVTTYEHTDSFDLVVVAGLDIDISVVNIFDNITTVVIEETERGRLKKRNTGHLHLAAFGKFVYLTEDNPHIIMYSRDPYVVHNVNGYTSTKPTPTIKVLEEVISKNEDFESGIEIEEEDTEEESSIPSYYWKPSRRGLE